jgi:MFS family permease
MASFALTQKPIFSYTFIPKRNFLSKGNFISSIMPVTTSYNDNGNKGFHSFRSRFFYGWVIVVSGFILLSASFGICYSFGVFFTPLQNEFSWNRATTSSLFSLYLLLAGVFSIIGGRASDKYGPKIVVLIMGIICGLSLVIMSRVQSSWQLYLTYSVLLSLGTGAMYIIVMSTGSHWFFKKRATALGIMGAGGGLGTVIMAPVSAWMILAYHWRSAYLIIGIAAWLVIIPAALLLKKKPSEIGVHIDGEPISNKTELSYSTAEEEYSLRETLTTRNFWLLFLIWFSYSFCLYMVMGHVVPRAEDIGMAPIRAAAILSILTAVAVPSRLVAGFVADMVDKRTIAAVFALIIAIAMFWLVLADKMWMLYLFAVIYGIAYGAIDPPIIALVGDIFGLSKVGAIMGFLMVGWGIGSATGPYIGGLIFDHTGEYQFAFSSGGLIMALAAICLLSLKIKGNQQFESRGASQ